MRGDKLEGGGNEENAAMLSTTVPHLQSLTATLRSHHTGVYLVPSNPFGQDTCAHAFLLAEAEVCEFWLADFVRGKKGDLYGTFVEKTCFISINLEIIKKEESLTFQRTKKLNSKYFENLSRWSREIRAYSAGDGIDEYGKDFGSETRCARKI